MTSQYSTSVTTGQGQYEWTNKINMGGSSCGRMMYPSIAAPPYTHAKTFTSGNECGTNQIVQSGAVEFSGCCTALDGSRNGSDSMESMQQHVSEPAPLLSDPESLSLSELDDTDNEDEEGKVNGKGQSTQRHCQTPHSLKVIRERKKVGRPLAYIGDPDAPDLTDLERRRIKRRIANRESARRVRNKRQELLDDSQVKMNQLQKQNVELRNQALESQNQREEISRQLAEMTAKYTASVATNANMQIELDALRSSLQVRMSMLEQMLDKQDPLGDGGEDNSLFASAQAQSAQNPGYLSQPAFPFVPQGDFSGSYSFQMALDNFPSLKLEMGERSQEIFNAEHADLHIFKANNLNEAKQSK